MSDLRSNSSLADIRTQIDTMRALARDSQISTALSYYATDATIPNSEGRIIWAVPIDKKSKEVADIVNDNLLRWNVDQFARDHILELATVGNLYIPTTDLYGYKTNHIAGANVALDFNTIKNKEYDIVASYKIPPEDVIHIYYQGEPLGYVLSPEEGGREIEIYPETSIIHFSLGGMLGDYTIDGRDKDGNDVTYDIKFAQPMLESATTPTQTLSLLEDALLLNSLIRTVRFINVECGDLEEEEVKATLQDIKDTIEQQLSINTATGDVQSFVNPQSPNNLIYLPRINGTDPISITDLNLTDTSENDSKLLDFYQDKKLSVLGVPKEALNFSSNEGLGGAGAVLSQRSALYANSLQRLETAYKLGWTQAMNNYFRARNMSGMCSMFRLEMQPIITQLSTVFAERRDAAISQAQAAIEFMKNLGIKQEDPYRKIIQEAIKDVFPQTGADVMTWNLKLDEEGGENAF